MKKLVPAFVFLLLFVAGGVALRMFAGERLAADTLVPILVVGVLASVLFWLAVRLLGRD